MVDEWFKDSHSHAMHASRNKFTDNCNIDAYCNYTMSFNPTLHGCSTWDH